jgi:glutathione synthase/RimK-type ligase-like ATP-grasp enzyme
MDKAILVLGDEEDPHVAKVLNKLQVPFRVINTWQIRSLVSLSMSDKSPRILWGNEPVDFQSLWCRLKPCVSPLRSEGIKFAVREWESLLVQMSHLLRVPGSRMMNDPLCQMTSSLKLMQLKTASELGLSIPETWISNDPDTVARLVESQPTIYKVLTWLATSDGKVGFTNEVTKALVSARRDSIALAPGLYQRKIPKSREFRTTVVDEQVFSVAIYSQELETTSLDWRRDQLRVRYELCDLPSGTEERLRKLMKALRLRYGAIDLVETPAGEIIFLEVNPEGNWLWLEERLGLNISGAIASGLERPTA